MRYIGKIKRISGNEITFDLDERVDVSELSRLSDGDFPTADVVFSDQRVISPEQRKKAWALLNDISRHTGYHPVDAEGWMKAYFMADTGSDYFSLSNCSVTTAREFISYLIEFCFQWNIGFKGKGLEMADDVRKYLWLCIKHRKCALCGQKADVHHIDAIGAGRDRREYDHTQSHLIALCRKHHNQAHQMGQRTFEERFKVQGIKLSARDVKDFKIGG